VVGVQEDLITIRDAARECGRTAETVRRWIWAGKLPAQKLGNQLFVRRADLPCRSERDRQRRIAERLAVLARIDANRERIYRRVGFVDSLETLRQQRESHPMVEDSDLR